jgi:hypothetical protein
MTNTEYTGAMKAKTRNKYAKLRKRPYKRKRMLESDKQHE